MNLNELKRIQQLNEKDFSKKNRSDYIFERLEIIKARGIKRMDRYAKNHEVEEIINYWGYGIKSGFYSILCLLSVIPLAIFYYISILFKFLFKKLDYYTSIIKPLADLQELILSLQTYLTIGNLGDYVISEKEIIEYKSQLDSTNSYYIWQVFFK